MDSAAQAQLALRTGMASTIIPNVLDLENPPKVSKKRTRVFRETIALAPEDRMILQPRLLLVQLPK